MADDDDDDAWGCGFEVEEEDADPVLAERGFDDEELATAIKVLGKLKEDLPAYKTNPAYKQLRASLLPFLDDVRGRLFDGKKSDVYERRKYNKQQANIRKTQKRDKDRKHLNATRLRSARIDTLNALCQADEAFPQVPDGAVDEHAEAGGARAIAGGGAGEGGGEGDGGAEGAAAGGPKKVELERLRSCYQCKCRFSELHEFYDQMCPACASLNFGKRMATADLSGRVALLTGARVKIGFQIGLKLLRAGATVIATTRFPADAARRFAAAPDFDSWSSRVHVHGLDLRDITRLEAFCAFLVETLPRLDIIVNNACQTIRRPPSYYTHLLEGEAAAPNATVAPLLEQQRQSQEQQQLLATGSTKPVIEAAAGLAPPTAPPSASLAVAGSDADVEAVPLNPALAGTVHPNLAPSAALSQVPLVAGDETHDPKLFPAKRLDVNEQQLDLRRENSWLLNLAQVSTPELVEVLAINTISPFVINSRLQPLLMRNPEVDKYVINVSAMEGKFYRFKTSHHPHTNMAKAALNMMTRTAAEELAASNVFMNAVDTGWINDENPRDKAAGIAATGFQTPLDEVDAAARVLDPVFVGAGGGEKWFGKFFKDYRETEW